MTAPKDGGAAKARWGKLTVEQLRGAYHACRILHTSPAIRGRGLEVLLQVSEEIADEIVSRRKKRARRDGGGE